MLYKLDTVLGSFSPLFVVLALALLYLYLNYFESTTDTYILNIQHGLTQLLSLLDDCHKFSSLSL